MSDDFDEAVARLVAALEEMRQELKEQLRKTEEVNRDLEAERLKYARER